MTIDMEHIKVNCEIDVENFVCPLSNEIFLDPVMADDGHLYERQMISTWLSNNNISPITRNEMSDNLKDCYVIKNILNTILTKHPTLKESQYKLDNSFQSNIPIIQNYIDNNRFDKLLDYVDYDMQYLVTNNLLDILEKCDNKVAKHIIDNCINFDFIDNRGYSAILWIAEIGNDEIIKHVIDKGLHLDYIDATGWSILHHLCLRGLTESIKYAINKGVPLEKENNNGWRPIHAACHYCNEDTIKLLISKGVNLKARIRRYNDENKSMNCVDLIKLNKKLSKRSKDDLIHLVYRSTKNRTIHKYHDSKKQKKYILPKNRPVKILTRVDV
jgi:ankyrin repeat protein